MPPLSISINVSVSSLARSTHQSSKKSEKNHPIDHKITQLLAKMIHLIHKKSSKGKLQASTKSNRPAKIKKRPDQERKNLHSSLLMLPRLPVRISHGELVKVRQQRAHHRVRRRSDRRRWRRHSVQFHRHRSARFSQGLKFRNLVGTGEIKGGQKRENGGARGF